MPITHVQNAGNNGSGTAAVTITPASLNGILMLYGANASVAATFAISDTSGHVWLPVNPLGNDAVGTAAQTWFARVKSLVSTTITLTPTPAAGFTNMLFDEFDGVDLNNPIGNVVQGNGSGTPTAGPIALTDDNMAIWAGCNDSVTGAGAGFTIAADDLSSDRTEFQVFVGQRGSVQTITFTGSLQYIVLAASLRERRNLVYVDVAGAYRRQVTG